MVNVGNFMTIWNILWPFGIIYGRLGNSLWSFVLFFPIWNVGTKKNLATLDYSRFLGQNFILGL
jgi:hypothetical protein